MRDICVFLYIHAYKYDHSYITYITNLIPHIFFLRVVDEGLFFCELSGFFLRTATTPPSFRDEIPFRSTRVPGSGHQRAAPARGYTQAPMERCPNCKACGGGVYPLPLDFPPTATWRGGGEGGLGPPLGKVPNPPYPPPSHPSPPAPRAASGPRPPDTRSSSMPATRAPAHGPPHPDPRGRGK